MEVKTYQFGKTLVDYLIDDERNVAMFLYPESKKDLVLQPWAEPEWPFSPRAPYCHGWFNGRLAHYHLVGQHTAYPGATMKSCADRCMPLISQELSVEGNKQIVKTLMGADRNCQLLHTLTYTEGLGGFEVETTFINAGSEDVTLDMLSSFALDNLTPFYMDDAPNTYRFHRFYSGPSKEGKHVCQTIEELSLEKSWPGWQQCVGSEQFGCRGSYSMQRYCPIAVFEDKKAGVFWGAQLVLNSTWQMELTRWDDSLSFTGGLGDRDFCGWKKHVKAGEAFTAPKAYVAVSDEDLLDVCGNLTDMMKPARKAYGEVGLPIAFNEYCATWGKPTQEKMLKFMETLKPYGVKYLVFDAGWCKGNENNEQGGNGEWELNTDIFPDIKAMNRTIRENGMIPGIWFEYEVTTIGAKVYEPEYDHMHLKKDGVVVNAWNRRTYWDLRRQDVQDYLQEHVIDFLRDNGFGYIKVDYNGNIGPEVDGAESGAEGLRQHQVCAREFFRKMKREIPGLVIENCAAGGQRNDPAMLSAAAFCSFSDAHESVEIPYIAANMHYMILPAQNGIWAVLHEDDSEKRLVYSLAATFLGRMYLSGPVDLLLPWQQDILMRAVNFYRKLENVIENGRSKLYGNRSSSMRYPEGVQVVLRKTEDEMMIVYHAFNGELKDVTFTIPEGYTVCDSFYGDHIHVDGTCVTIRDCEALSAGAVYLKKQ